LLYGTKAVLLISSLTNCLACALLVFYRFFLRPARVFQALSRSVRCG